MPASNRHHGDNSLLAKPNSVLDRIPLVTSSPSNSAIKLVPPLLNMELELTRIDYGSVGTTSRNCLKLLPQTYKKQQKVVIADIDGHVQLFSIKKTEAQIVFQAYAGQKVACVQLGGAVGSSHDKIFVATENIVKGYTKKGKMFLSFDTNLTEPIKCMFVLGPDLVVCGNHVYNHYRDCKDIGTYLCGDTIVDVVTLCPNNTNRILTILACSGRVLRVLEHCRVRQTIELDSVPTTLHVRKTILGDKIMCGFSDGKIVAYNFSGFIGEAKNHTILSGDYGNSAVTCIDTYDLTEEGHENLLVGRRDGTVQVFTLPSDDDVDLDPRELYRECFAESISSIQGGCVYSGGATEIVIATYAGSVFGLTTKIVSINLTDRDMFKELLMKSVSKKQTDLEETAVVEDNKINLVKPQERYSLTTQIVSTSSNTLSAVLDINDSITLDATTATYTLYIEMPVPILEILYQSEPAIVFIDTDNNANATLFKNPVESTSGYEISIRAKIKDDNSQITIQFQTAEGQYGGLEAFIMPNTEPNCVQLKSYMIRPLSLHIRIHSFDETRPFNELSLKGAFSWAEVHTWIEQMLPEVPERLSGGNDSVDLYYKNVLVGSVLECKYGKGLASFRSDNVSTISILKDFLTKEATKKRIKLEISSKIAELSIPHVLHLIESELKKLNKVKEEHKFLLALLQVKIRNEEDWNCLLPKYQSILERRSEIEVDFAKTPDILQRYYKVITDLYIDRFKFKGMFVREKIPELMNLLEDWNGMGKIVEFFEFYTPDENNSAII